MNLMEQVQLALFQNRSALDNALLTHYCRSMAKLLNRSEAEIRAEVMAEYAQEVERRRQHLEGR